MIAATAGPLVALNASSDLDDRTQAVFLQRINEDTRAYAHLRYYAVYTHTPLTVLLDRLGIGPDEAPLFSYREPVLTGAVTRDQQVSLLPAGALLLVKAAIPDHISTWLAGSSEVQLDQLSLIVQETLVPVQDEEPDRGAWVNFWHMTQAGPNHGGRRFYPPPWTEIAGNYSQSVREQLERLNGLREVPQSGRMILLYGPPGTGKTRALLTLFLECQSWLSTHYIMDTERFFSDPGYMTTVITEDMGETQHARLLVVEDADELIAGDARQRTGQALSRLLNLTDGLIGQGTNTFVLITTNEPLSKVHPALRRAGRCLAEIEVTALTPQESREWAEQHRVVLEHPERPHTIADLYALLGGGMPMLSQAPPRQAGFTAPVVAVNGYARALH